MKSEWVERRKIYNEKRKTVSFSRTKPIARDLDEIYLRLPLTRATNGNFCRPFPSHHSTAFARRFMMNSASIIASLTSSHFSQVTFPAQEFLNPLLIASSKVASLRKRDWYRSFHARASSRSLCSVRGGGGRGEWD